MKGSTFVETWKLWPWFQSIREGSLEQLSPNHPSNNKNNNKDNNKNDKIKNSDNEDKYTKSEADPRSLLLCWPDIDSLFAKECLQRYSGNKCVFIGELRGGCTADNSFFDELQDKWTLSKEHSKGTSNNSIMDEEEEEVEEKILVYVRNQLLL